LDLLLLNTGIVLFIVLDVFSLPSVKLVDTEDVALLVFIEVSFVVLVIVVGVLRLFVNNVNKLFSHDSKSASIDSPLESPSPRGYIQVAPNSFKRFSNALLTTL